MKLAVTYENGNVFQHFGHTEYFKIYTIQDGEIKSSEVKSSDGAGHESLAFWLKDAGVDALICGGIGDGAKQALDYADVYVYGGVTGSADAAAQAFASGTLSYNPDVHCSHHDGEGHEGHHCHHA
jgi:predicted Fe-Mo cluster-binding NifX family protein